MQYPVVLSGRAMSGGLLDQNRHGALQKVSTSAGTQEQGHERGRASMSS